MSTKVGRFEIISQLAESSWATVYKALDPEGGQPIALKVVPLDRARDGSALLEAVFGEADQARPLSSHNIASLYGVGDEDGKLLAASQYVEGNSIRTALARKDSFSIWDLEDIARQVAQALDHAQFHQSIHCSLEPAKIMVEWEGTVKVLGFGISTMNARAAQNDSVPEILHYAAPEQLRSGEAVDHRAALFSLGAILYEMATGEKAFPGNTPDQVRTAILEGMPAVTERLAGNLSGLSALIAKALSKSPEKRYQSGRELVADLERSKAGVAKAPPKPKTQTSAGGAHAKATQGAVQQAAALGGQAASEKPLSPAPSQARAVVKVDPAMEETASPTPVSGISFSDISELPPLQESELSSQPSVPETAVPAEPPPRRAPKDPEPIEAKVQVRETAERAIKELRKIPPQLYLYALGGALVVMAMIAGGILLHGYWEERDQERPSASAPPAAPPVQPQKPFEPAPPPSQPIAEEKAQDEESVTSEAQPQDEPAAPAPERHASGVSRQAKRRAAVAPAQAQLTISSSPAGADISFDGNLLCQSPCTLTDIPPGEHSLAAVKQGYSRESRSVRLSSGANSTLAFELNPLAASVSVASTPGGAVIVIDGQDTGKLTPSQLTLAKPGTHTVVLRRSGYLDETSSIEAQAGQTASVNLALKRLGSTEEIRPVAGKFKKLLSHESNSSMGIVSVKTQPKGAQIMVNNRVLDKTAPFDFYLNPGTYVVDITLSGYKGVHRVINVGQLEKVAIEETLTPE